MQKVILFWSIVVMLAMSGCTRTPKESQPIRLGIDVWSGYAYAFIAQEKGFFKKNGVDVKLVLNKEVTNCHLLYVKRLCDGFLDSYPSAIRLNVEGMPLKVVYFADYSDSADGLIGRPEFSSPADLKGKTVGFDEVNSFSHIFVLEVLKKYGLTEGDVYFKEVQADQVLKELDEGKIAAGHTWNPTKKRALGKGYKMLAKASEVPAVNIDTLAFDPDILKKRHSDVEKLVKSLVEARDFLNSNYDEAVEIMARSEGMTFGEMDEGVKDTYRPGLKENVEAFKKSDSPLSLYSAGNIISEFYLARGQWVTAPDFDKILDSSFVDSVWQQKYSVIENRTSCQP